MAMNRDVLERKRTQQVHSAGPKRGDDLFAGTTYPRDWDEYIGQEDAVEWLRVACSSAKLREARLDHILIATGMHGIGKSALARLIAKEMGAGLVEVQGALTEQDAMRIFASMSDGDILFYDEFHQAVSKGKAKAEWLLSVLQDGVMVTSRGVLPIPDITIIAATTDIQKVQETIISRFAIKPAMESYTDEQALTIAKVTALRVWGVLPDKGFPVPDEGTCKVVARAANNNPRGITQLLKTLRDTVISGRALDGGNGMYSTDTMFRFAQVTPDGLDKLAQDYIEILNLEFQGSAGEKAIARALGEPTPPGHTEKLLIQKGFLSITPTGRELTSEGLARARQISEERRQA